MAKYKKQIDEINIRLDYYNSEMKGFLKGMTLIEAFARINYFKSIEDNKNDHILYLVYYSKALITQAFELMKDYFTKLLSEYPLKEVSDINHKDVDFYHKYTSDLKSRIDKIINQYKSIKIYSHRKRTLNYLDKLSNSNNLNVLFENILKRDKNHYTPKPFDILIINISIFCQAVFHKDIETIYNDYIENTPNLEARDFAVALKGENIFKFNSLLIPLFSLWNYRNENVHNIWRDQYSDSEFKNEMIIGDALINISFVRYLITSIHSEINNKTLEKYSYE